MDIQISGLGNIVRNFWDKFKSPEADWISNEAAQTEAESNEGYSFEDPKYGLITEGMIEQIEQKAGQGKDLTNDEKALLNAWNTHVATNQNVPTYVEDDEVMEADAITDMFNYDPPVTADFTDMQELGVLSENIAIQDVDDSGAVISTPTQKAAKVGIGLGVAFAAGKVLGII